METPVGKRRSWLKESHLSIVSILGVFVLWFLVTRDGLGIVKPVIFPSPLMVVEAAISTSSLIGTDVFYTMFRVVCGLVTGTVLGIMVGMLVCFNNKLYYLLGS